jgi:hypothetical protein
MSITYNTEIVRDGLVIHFDPANVKSYTQNKNILTSSSIINNWAVNGNTSIIANSGTDPDGLNTATRFNTTQIGGGVYNFITTFAGKTYTYSVYLKHISGGAQVYFGNDGSPFTLISANTATGEVLSHGGSPQNIVSTSVGNGWYRFSFSLKQTANPPLTSIIIYSLNAGNSSFLVWGPQIENGSSVTSYSPTSTPNVVFTDLASRRVATTSNDFRNINGFLPYNGTSSAISFPTSGLDFSKEQTIMIGLMPDENNANRRNPYDHEYGGYGTITHEPSGEFNYYWGPYGAQSEGYATITSPFTVGQNEKTIITASRGSQYARWYKNGTLSLQGSNSVPVAGTSTGTAKIGHGYAGYYSGNIYFFMLYNRQLTDAEVLKNYNALRGRCGI